MALDNNRRILITTTLGVMIAPYVASSINTAIPSLVRDLGLDTVLMNWVVLSATLASAVFIIPMGKTADRIGRKNLFVLGLVLHIISSFFCGISQSGITMVIFRGLQGICGTIITVTSIAMVSSAYAEGDRGKAIGLNTAAVYISISMAPFAGGFLTTYLGWRSTFFVVIPVDILLLALLLGVYEEQKKPRQEHFDYTGSAIFAAGLFCLIYGLSSLETMYLVICGLVSFLLFGFYETKINYPVLDIKLLISNKVLLFAVLATLISYTATFSVSYLISLYLQHIKGFAPEQAGLVLAIQPALQAVFSPFTGRMSDKLDPKRVSSLGMVFISAGMLLLTFVSVERGTGVIFAALSVLGLGIALFASPNTVTIMYSVPKQHYGMSSSLISVARAVGQAVSMGITTMVLDFYIDKNPLNPSNYPEFVQGLHVIFIILALLCIFGIFFSVKPKRDCLTGRKGSVRT